MQSRKESGVSLVLRIAPDDSVIYANQDLADYLGHEKQMLIGCPLDTIRELSDGEIRDCFQRTSDAGPRNQLVTDNAGRVFEAKTSSEAGVFDIILDEVTSLEPLLAELDSQSGIAAHSLSETELSTFRRPDRRVVTVCTTQLHGLSSVADRVPPLELRILISSFFEEVSTEMLASGGTLIDSSPDSITAIFGAPRNHANHTLRAITAAIRQTEKLERLRKVLRRLGKELPATGCGIWTGEAVVGHSEGKHPLFIQQWALRPTVPRNSQSLRDREKSSCQAQG